MLKHKSRTGEIPVAEMEASHIINYMKMVLKGDGIESVNGSNYAKLLAYQKNHAVLSGYSVYFATLVFRIGSETGKNVSYATLRGSVTELIGRDCKARDDRSIFSDMTVDQLNDYIKEAMKVLPKTSRTVTSLVTCGEIGDIRDLNSSIHLVKGSFLMVSSVLFEFFIRGLKLSQEANLAMRYLIGHSYVNPYAEDGDAVGSDLEDNDDYWE